MQLVESSRAVERKHFACSFRSSIATFDKMEPARDRGGHRRQLFTTVGAVALLIGSGEFALAANECGLEAAGPDTIICTGGSYPAAISYTNSDDVILNINNGAIDVGPAPGGIQLIGGAANTNDIAVNGLPDRKSTAGCSEVAGRLH